MKRVVLAGVAASLSLFASGCVGTDSGAGTSSAGNSIVSSAQNFVAICTPVVLASDNREAVMASKGLNKGAFGFRREIGSKTWIHAGTKPGDNCRLSFGGVWPRNEVMKLAITSHLQQAGFKPTGQTLPISGGPLSGTGATSRDVYSNGSKQVTLEVAGGNSTAPIWALRKYN